MAPKNAFLGVAHLTYVFPIFLPFFVSFRLETWIQLKNLILQSFPMYFRLTLCPKKSTVANSLQVNTTQHDVPSPIVDVPRYYPTPAINTPIHFTRLHLLKSTRPRNPASIPSWLVNQPPTNVPPQKEGFNSQPLLINGNIWKPMVNP